MCEKRTRNRRAVRAAVRIHEHLRATAGRCNVNALPITGWQELCRCFRRYELAQRRGWQAASAALVPDLGYTLHRLAVDLEAVKRDLPEPHRPTDVCSAGTIAADLLALPVEFEAVHIDLKSKTVSVNTPNIVLEDLDLGPFQIVLRWERIGAGRAYLVKALEPNCPAGRSDVTHPHVENHYLCEGAGGNAIRSAVTSGRLLDFFLLVRQILETYNGSSPYVALEKWSEGGDVSCHDCGYETSPDDIGHCELCDAAICSDCTTSCSDCNRYVCSECSGTCSQCEHAFCQSCREEAAEKLFCKSCLQHQQEAQAHEDNEPPAPAADALCLGETAAAA